MENTRKNNFECLEEKVSLIDYAKRVIDESDCSFYDEGAITELIVSTFKDKTIKEKAAIASVLAAGRVYNFYNGIPQFLMPKHEECFRAFKEARKNLQKGYVYVSCLDENNKKFSLRIDTKYRYQAEYDSQKRIISLVDNFGKNRRYHYDSEGHCYYSNGPFFDEWYDNDSGRIVYNSTRKVRYTYTEDGKCIAIHSNGNTTVVKRQRQRRRG